MPTTPIDLLISARDRTGPAFSSATRRADRFSKQIGGIGGTLLRIGPRLAAGLAGATAVIAREVAVAVDRLDEIDKAAQAAGIPPEVLQTWQLFGETVGSTTVQTNTSLRRFRRRLGEAQTGSTETAAAFAKLGVAVRNVDGTARSVDETWADFTRRLSTTNDATGDFALGVRILDQEGARLVQGLINSGGEFENLAARAQSAGAIIGGDVVQAAVRAKDEVTIMTTALEAQRSVLAAEFIPALENLATTVMPFWIERIREARGLLSDLFDSRANEALNDELEDNIARIDSLNAQLDAQVGTEDELVIKEAQRNALLERQVAIRRELRGIAEAEAAADTQERQTLDLIGEGGTEARVEAERTIAELARIQYDAARQRREVAIEVLNIRLREGEITREQYDEEIARLQGIREAKEAEQEAEQGLFETTLERFRTRQAELELARGQLAVAEVTGRITADEAARLREILGIKMEEIALEQERTPAIEQENDLLIQQQNIMVNIGSSLRGFQDSTEGWIGLLGEALSIFSQFRSGGMGGQGGGGGGILGILGGLFGGFRQHGGPISPGKIYGVGEVGPEWIIPSTPGYVLPNNFSRSSSMNITTNINNPVLTSSMQIQDLQRIVRETVQQASARSKQDAFLGRIPQPYGRPA